MTHHNKEFPRQAELTQSLKDHGLNHKSPSQLADAFRFGWRAALALATPAPAQPEGQEDEPAALVDTRNNDLRAHWTDRSEAAKLEHGTPLCLRPSRAAAPAQPDPLHVANERGEAWQPIETAPKDGSEVLAWEPGIGRMVLFFHVSREAPEGAWIDGLSGENFHPSQWWPVLPAAPKEKT